MATKIIQVGILPHDHIQGDYTKLAQQICKEAGVTLVEEVDEGVWHVEVPEEIWHHLKRVGAISIPTDSGVIEAELS